MRKIIHILGLGESLKHYVPDGNETIGVNDIFKHHAVDFLVCVDRPLRFSKERFETIKNSKSKKFYSIKFLQPDGECIDEWEKYFNNYVSMKLQSPRGNFSNIDNEKYCYGLCSPIVATALAYKLGATEIVLHGIDLINHTEIKGLLAEKSIQEFISLKKELEKRNISIFVGSKETALYPHFKIYTK